MPALPNIRHLRAFETVVRLESVNAAAEAINLSQPALTQAMARLEARFGARLLSRRASGSYVTPAGGVLARRVARCLEQIDEALSQCLGATLRREGALAVARNRLTSAQIRAVIAIARAGSFGQAARMLGLAESSLHRVARDCERALGRTLFHRSASGVSVNRAAAEMARRWQVALREIEQAEEEMRLCEGAGSGRVAVACLPLARTLILPRAVNALLRRRPDVHVEIIDGSYDALLRNLREGTVDMLIGALRRPPPVDDIVQTQLLVDPYAVVARAGHPLFARGSVTAAMLAEYDWVIPREGTPVRHAFEALFATVPEKPRACVETSSLVATRGLLAESDRLTLLSERQITIEKHLGLLKIVPFPLPETERPIGVTTRHGWLGGPVQHEFLDCLRLASANAFYDNPPPDAARPPAMPPVPTI